MPKKIKFNVGITDEDVSSAESGYYAGDTPPRGLYRVKLQQFRLKKNKNDDYMLNGLLVIDGETGEKKQYNGYGFWFNINITEQSAPYLANFFLAFGFDPKKFASAGAMTDDDNAITKICGKNVTDKLAAYVMTKRTEYQGEQRLQVAGRGFISPDSVKARAEDDPLFDWEDDSSSDVEPDADESDETEDVGESDETEESDATYDDGESDEDADEESEEEEEEEEEESEDDEGWTLEQLLELGRTELKKMVRDLDSEFVVRKSMTDEDLANRILELSEESDDEDGDETPF